MRAYLYAQGFQRVLALHPQVCGLESADATLWICLWGYQAAEPADRTQGEIHPYYPASQRAYLAARQAVAEGEKRGLHLRQDTELRLKPLFAHLRGFSQGRNTLSSVEGMGSRFHVQVLWMSEEAEAYDDALWEDASHGLSCGACKACLAACPTGALDAERFQRERCLRNWMLSGRPIPEEMRPAMGNLLVGCDACQRCCPQNTGLSWGSGASIALDYLLRSPKDAAQHLSPQIGFNLAIPNRILGQALLAAGNSGDKALLPLVKSWTEHASPVVREHARWAGARLENLP